MEEGKLKIDGMSFLTSLIINFIVFSLAFVYVARGPAGETRPVEAPTTPEETPVLDILIEKVPGIPTPADFVEGDENENDTLLNDVILPQFDWEFNSKLLPSPYRGKIYSVYVELEIDGSGKLLSEPKILTSSGEKVVDDETINRLKQAEFTPALDSKTGDFVGAKVPLWIMWYPVSG